MLRIQSRIDILGNVLSDITCSICNKQWTIPATNNSPNKCVCEYEVDTTVDSPVIDDVVPEVDEYAVADDDF